MDFFIDCDIENSRLIKNQWTDIKYGELIIREF